MIPASELRIGNRALIRPNADNYDTSSEAYITASHIAEIENGEIIASGIPLTEEWLLKFGFDKRTNFNPNPHNIVFAWMYAGFLIIPTHRNNEYLFWWESGNTTINHVHQLQNLYFALTGKELAILI